MADSKSDSVKELVLEEYDALAAEYDQKWLWYTQKTLALTLDVLQPECIPAQQSLLDIGCGTGQFLEMLEQRTTGVELFGIEPNGEMLGRARAKFADQIECVEGWAHDLPFEDASFDYVTCNNMFHYVDEPLQALSEFRRVLKPSGSLVLMDWCGDYWTMSLNAFYLDIRKKAHVRTYRQAELLKMLQDAGFTNIVLKRKKINWFWVLMVAKAHLN